METTAVHWHLGLVHLPIAGSLFAILFLLGAEALRKDWLLKSAAIVLVLTALSAAGAYFTGEPAEDLLGAAAAEDENAFGEAPEWVGRHESRALWAVGTAAAAGLGGILVLIHSLRSKGQRPPTSARAALLVLAIATAGTMGYTGLAGGEIRHTEIRPPAASR